MNHIAKELMDLSPKVKGGTISFETDIRIELKFIADNYAAFNDHKLNASMLMFQNNIEYNWVDLFHLVKSLTPNEQDLAIIKNGESWEESILRQQVVDILHPVLASLLDKRMRALLLNGEELSTQEFNLQLSSAQNYKWILEKSFKLRQSMD